MGTSGSFKIVRRPASYIVLISVNTYFWYQIFPVPVLVLFSVQNFSGGTNQKMKISRQFSGTGTKFSGILQ